MGLNGDHENPQMAVFGVRGQGGGAAALGALKKGLGASVADGGLQSLRAGYSSLEFLNCNAYDRLQAIKISSRAAGSTTTHQAVANHFTSGS